MISVPLFILAGIATVVCWRLSDARVIHLLCALVCGYALATSPISGAIDAFGDGLGKAVQSASSDAAS
ncbi:hypothetical protein OHA98_42385 [Streptomyces sp. NBC_00654]|uniref:hypothetical protein n=1 Tax=Streptomyces sp. NBC_00654 TaxID=2975799 RepID=UPI002257A2D8|nr:hypothetical protein [Streptomyces sp. NBC_00654]MCX4971250.1 hypothetical protein [Streptomyces sp. NBC_00654]